MKKIKAYAVVTVFLGCAAFAPGAEAGSLTITSQDQSGAQTTVIQKKYASQPRPQRGRTSGSRRGTLGSGSGGRQSQISSQAGSEENLATGFRKIKDMFLGFNGTMDQVEQEFKRDAAGSNGN